MNCKTVKRLRKLAGHHPSNPKKYTGIDRLGRGILRLGSESTKFNFKRLVSLHKSGALYKEGANV